MKAYSQREVKKILKENNWYLVRVSGGHQTYKNDEQDGLLTINQKPNKITFNKLVKMYNLQVNTGKR